MDCKNCHQCLKNKKVMNIPLLSTRMVLCPDCGNKRCPKANDHRNACTNSNEVGQIGSAYPKPFLRKQFLLIPVFLLALSISANAQTVDCSDLQDCQQKLSRAASQIEKLLDVTEAQEKAIEALKSEIESRKRLSLIDAEIIAKKDFQLAEQEKLIQILRKETRRQISILFGLIKVRF